MQVDLIAPCGMNCRLCYGYIRTQNRCLGCNAPDGSKPKSCISCKIIACEKRKQNGWKTCAPCDTSCRRIKDLDKRYRTKYHMSMLNNLKGIREGGMEMFLRQQEEKYSCPVCGGVLCVHRAECPSCKTAAWETVDGVK